MKGINLRLLAWYYGGMIAVPVVIIGIGHVVAPSFCQDFEPENNTFGTEPGCAPHAQLLATSWVYFGMWGQLLVWPAAFATAEAEEEEK